MATKKQLNTTEEEIVSQTEMEPMEAAEPEVAGSPAIAAGASVFQTETEQPDDQQVTLVTMESTDENARDEPIETHAPPKSPTPSKRRKVSKSSQSGEGMEEGAVQTSDNLPEHEESDRKRQSVKPKLNVLTIDEERTVETELDKARNDLLDLTESMKTGRILSGSIQGVERPNNRAHAYAVIYHGAFKVIIPAEEAVEAPDDLRDQSIEDILHYLLTKRLGAEVDFIIKGIDSDAGIAVASRLEAMRAKRKQYYFGTDRDGNNLLYSGLCAEARVVSVIRAGIFVDLFGLEVYIPLRELSYQRLMDAAGYFQPGQRILVKITEVDRSNKSLVKASASVKQAAENPYEKALRMYAEGNRYVGTVSMVDTNGVFVALDGGIDCLCSYPKRGRPPRGARVTVRILGINHETNRIWGAITHIATPR